MHLRSALILIFVVIVSGQDEEVIEYDPNGIYKIFRYLEEHPESSMSLIIKEDQRIFRENETCIQYDYISFKWINQYSPSPFPDLTDGNEFCTVVDCDDVFGPAESVNCSKHFS